MGWEISFHDEFVPEFKSLAEEVRVALLAQAEFIEEFGPLTARPWVDTLKGSAHANMKELRFDAGNGVWRVAFAFDTERTAILLVAGDKSGGSEAKFYKQMIKKADARFSAHQAALKIKKAR